MIYGLHRLFLLPDTGGDQLCVQGFRRVKPCTRE